MTDSNLSEIPNGAIRAALVEFIEEKLTSKTHKIVVSSASKAGESNFIGIVYRVSYCKQNETDTSKLILKIAPQNEARRNQFQSRQLFLQEIFTYDTVRMTTNNVEFKWIYKFYFSRLIYSLKYIYDHRSCHFSGNSRNQKM